MPIGKDAEQARIWRELGLCTRCGKRRDDEYIQCVKCRTKMRQKIANRRAKGLCIKCCKPTGGTTMCSDCGQKEKLRKGPRRYAQQQRAKARNRLAGRCDCGAVPIHGSLSCERCWFYGKGGKGVFPEHLKALLVAQGFRCVYSGKLLAVGSPDTHLDHKIPRSRGGTNNIENLQWVSKRVNMMKTTFTHEEFIRACAVIAKRWPTQNQKHIESAKKLMPSYESSRSNTAA